MLNYLHYADFGIDGEFCEFVPVSVEFALASPAPETPAPELAPQPDKTIDITNIKANNKIPCPCSFLYPHFRIYHFPPLK